MLPMARQIRLVVLRCSRRPPVARVVNSSNSAWHNHRLTVSIAEDIQEKKTPGPAEISTLIDCLWFQNFLWLMIVICRGVRIFYNSVFIYLSNFCVNIAWSSKFYRALAIKFFGGFSEKEAQRFSFSALKFACITLLF